MPQTSSESVHRRATPRRPLPTTSHAALPNAQLESTTRRQQLWPSLTQDRTPLHWKHLLLTRGKAWAGWAALVERLMEACKNLGTPRRACAICHAAQSP
eukprot:6131176-Pyramimonas_sp.AAC.1